MIRDFLDSSGTTDNASFDRLYKVDRDDFVLTLCAPHFSCFTDYMVSECNIKDARTLCALLDKPWKWKKEYLQFLKDNRLEVFR